MFWTLLYTLCNALASAIVAVVVIVGAVNLGLIQWASSVFILLVGSVVITTKVIDRVTGAE